MAAKLKGEVSFKALASTFTLVVDFNAICAIEEELDIKIDEIGDRLKGSGKTIRSVFRIGLAARHGALTDFEAGNLIQEIGVMKAAELLAEAMTASFPEAKNPASPRAPATAPETAGA